MATLRKRMVSVALNVTRVITFLVGVVSMILAFSDNGTLAIVGGLVFLAGVGMTVILSFVKESIRVTER